MKKIRLCKTVNEQNDEKFAPIIQIGYYNQIKNAVNASVYGLHSSPEIDTPCLLIYVNNDPANAYIVPLSIKERKNLSVTKLKKTEVIIGNFAKNSSVFFDELGNIKIETSKNIEASGNNVTVTVSGDLDAAVSGDVNITGNNVNITGPTTVTGNLSTTGTLTAGAGFSGTGLTVVNVSNGIVTGGS